MHDGIFFFFPLQNKVMPVIALTFVGLIFNLFFIIKKEKKKELRLIN